VADEQIRIDVTATDDASPALEDVADRLDALEGRDTTVDVAADTGAAAAGLEQVDAAAADLEGRDTALVVTADATAAAAALEDTDAAARELADRDVEIVLEAKVKNLKGQLAGAEADLDRLRRTADRTEESVRDVGDSGGIAGNSMADLAGPLGDAEGAASTAAGVFDGLSDIVSGLGPSLGLSAAASTQLATGLGIAGFAVAGIAAAYTKFTGDQKKAREEAERTAAAQRDINAALQEGDAAAAATEFLDLYPGMEEAANKAGLSIGAATRYITGQTDSLGPLEAKARALKDTNDATRAGYEQMFGPMQALRAEYVASQGGAEALTSAEQQVKDALFGSADGAEAARQAQMDLIDARMEAADAGIHARDSEARYMEAVAATTAAQRALDTAIAEHGPTSEEATAATHALGRATLAERDAAVESSKAQAALAEETALAGGKSFDSAQRIGVLNRSLIESARTATPAARREIIRYIAEVNNISEEKATKIVASATGTEQAANEIAEVAGRDYTAEVSVVPDFGIWTRRMAGLGGRPGMPFGLPPAGNPGGEVTGAVAVPATTAAGAPVLSPRAVRAPAPALVVNVDARGALDPYTVGRRVEEALTSWRGIASGWRPGVPA
jgi:hypothetical protein